MRFSSPLRVLLASSLASFAAVGIGACGDDADSNTQSTTPEGKAGAAGQAGGSAGKSGASGSSAGKGGSASGSAGSTAGSAGSTAGSAGSTAGSAGSTAGSAGSTAGSAGSAGSTAGGAGSTAGSAGTTAGSAGSTAGSAGSTAGSAGATAGSGGSTAGNAGSGGSTAGAGGNAGASAGSGGTAGSGGGQSVAQPQCGGIVDTCTLHDDCCNCLSLGPNETPPVCDVKLCKATACELLGKPATNCVAGQCTLTLGCGSAEVTCKQKAPTCPKGQVPEVKDNCWTAKCLDVRDCSHVSSCSDCQAAGLTCVEISTNSAFPIVHCIDLPPACKESSCSCLGPAVCTGGANLCSDTKAGVTCSCPNC